MRFYIIPFLLLMVSCKDPFNPELDTVNSPLVVEGLITNEAKPYEVKLYRALQYNSIKNKTNVTKAKVKVIDDLGHTYGFVEKETGVYRSNPAEFVGQAGRTYTLTIETNDTKFKSKPQKLLPNDFNVTTYAEFGSKDVLSTDAYGSSYKETVQGVNLLADIENNLDSLPRFRFEHKSYREYTYSIQVSMMKTDLYYGWNAILDNDLVNITDDKYQTTSKNIEKHTVCFLPTVYDVQVEYLDSTNQPVTISAYVLQQVTKVTRYRINNETFQFYKDINRLLAAEGKMFDPIAFQVNGNIQCISNPQIPVLGFFEASSVDISYYAIKPGKKVVVKVKSFEPPSPSGYVIIPPFPDFWVY
jgi:hypothetical protein